MRFLALACALASTLTTILDPGTAAAQCTEIAYGNGELMAGWMTLKTDGSVWYAEQSMETQVSLRARKIVQLGNDVVAVGENDGESATFCAIKANRELWCFGQNDKGQLGDGMAYYWTYEPHMIMTEVKQVSNSAEFTCATKMDGTAWCWGENTYGQHGTGDTQNHIMPTQVPGLTDVDVISAGFDHTCALKTNGELWCWGGDTYGQVGTGRALDGQPFTYNSPQRIMGITGTVEQISAGGFYTMAIASGGQVWAWGANGHAHLALGTFDDISDPTMNPNLTSIRQVDTAVQGGCALTMAGQVKCWGRNQFGELGNGMMSTNDQTTPLDVPGMTNVRSVHSVDRSVCAVKNDDSLWCWGGGGFMDASGSAVSPREIDYCSYCQPSDCSGGTPSCIDGACAACTDDDECSDPTNPACAVAGGNCRQCNENVACTGGLFCTDGAGGDCVVCRDEFDCDPGQRCDTSGAAPACVDGAGGGGASSSCGCRVGEARVGYGALLLCAAAVVLLVWLRRRR
jgi:alpha-tubulin suppressor-like RCC1 family protein